MSGTASAAACCTSRPDSWSADLSLVKTGDTIESGRGAAAPAGPDRRRRDDERNARVESSARRFERGYGALSRSTFRQANEGAISISSRHRATARAEIH